MGALRFVILKQIEGESKVVLEYNEDKIRERLKNISVQNLPLMTVTKRRFTREEVMKAVESAWDTLVHEFKEETIRI